jgi:hypothetical protein
VEQVFLTESQLKGMAGVVPPVVQKLLRGLKYVAVLSYRLPATAVPKEVISFYEPRLLKSGYKLSYKDLSESDEVTAMYSGPKENFVVVAAESSGELEIVSVEGPLSSLAAMGDLMKKAGTPKPKPAPGPVPAPAAP